MKDRVVLVHGIGPSRGEHSVDRFALLLRAKGFEVVEFDYKFSRLWHQRWKKKHDANARALVDMLRPGDVVIAHSNGCRVLHRALELGAVIRMAILFSPAMSSAVVWATGVQRIFVIHNAYDKAVAAGSWLLGHGFGALGRDGYQGDLDLRVSSISDAAAKTSDKHFFIHINHSHYFSGRRLRQWVGMIENWCLCYD